MKVKLYWFFDISNNHGLTKIHVVWAYPLVCIIIEIGSQHRTSEECVESHSSIEMGSCGEVSQICLNMGQRLTYQKLDQSTMRNAATWKKIATLPHNYLSL